MSITSEPIHEFDLTAFSLKLDSYGFQYENERINASKSLRLLSLSILDVENICLARNQVAPDNLIIALKGIQIHYLGIRYCMPLDNATVEKICGSLLAEFIIKNNIDVATMVLPYVANLVHSFTEFGQNIFFKALQTLHHENISLFLKSLVELLNLPDELLSRLVPIPIRFKAKEGIVSAIKMQGIPSFEKIISLKSPRLSRKLLADCRRFDYVSSRSLREIDDNHEPSIYEALFNDYAQRLLDSTSESVSKTYFAILCLCAKFYIKRSVSIEVYEKLKSSFVMISEDAELIFLSNAGLNHLVASKIARLNSSDLVLFYDRFNFNFLGEYYKHILFKRITGGQIQSINSSSFSSIAVVIATTDDHEKEILLALSLLSACLQSLIPSEVYIFIDPVKNDVNYANKLVHRVKTKAFDEYIDLDSKSRDILDSIVFNIEINSSVKGQYYARNRAVSQTLCDYISIQDDDDLSDFNRFKIQYEYISKRGLAVYGKHLRISSSGFFQHDSREYNFLGDGIASLFTYTHICKKHPFLEVKSRGDVEFRERIRQIYGDNSIVYLENLLLLMRGANNTVSCQFEVQNKKAFDYFYSSIATHSFS